MASRQCVVLIPVYSAAPSWTETFVLRQCAAVLGSYPIRLCAPVGLNDEPYREVLLAARAELDLATERYHAHYFSGIPGYNRLLLSQGFYRRFRDYEYALIHQLDAYVFRNEIPDWCARGYDYVGAPWFEGYLTDDPEAPFKGVGNGGFSLRRVAACLRVLRSFHYLKRPRALAAEVVASAGLARVGAVGRMLRGLTVANNTFSVFNDYPLNEDAFFGMEAPRLCEWFRVAPPETALRFAFEVQPRVLFERNGGQLPFGCHGFEKHQPDFWRAHIPEFARQP